MELARRRPDRWEDGPRAPGPGDLQASAQVWLDRGPWDSLGARSFLATFAVDLVRWLRFEDARRALAQDPFEQWHRREHLGLVVRIQGLREAADLGEDVRVPLRGFLADLERHCQVVARQDARTLEH